MSRLADERTALLEALVAGGIRIASSAKLAAPCVLVQPGDPWSSPARLPGRTSRWRLTAVAAAPDTIAGEGELAELVDLVDAALRRLDGAELPTWAAPAVRDLGDGVRHASTIATIQYASS